MDEMMWARYEALSAKVLGPTLRVIMDTPEKAVAEGVPIGTTVLFKQPPSAIASMDDMLEFGMLSEYLHRNP